MVTLPQANGVLELDADPKSILFLDDEKLFVEQMTLLLSEHLSCPIVAHIKPLEALAALAQAKVSVIVTDYYMPVMNGFEFIKLAHALVPNAAIILISGHTLDMSEEELRKLPGLKTMLHKPLSWRVLARNIIQHWPNNRPPTLKE